MPEEKSFSNNEAMMLIEGFRNDIRAIAEDTASLGEDMVEVKERLAVIQAETQAPTDAVKTVIPNHERCLVKLEVKVGK